MVTPHRHANWKIAMYAADHGVPHVHIEGPGFRCSIAIETRAMIIGDAPARAIAEARAWAAGNQAELAAKWRELNE
jgi:hypothetical protein